MRNPKVDFSGLTQTPERRRTILPELMHYFQKSAGDDWRMMFQEFIQRFAGMRIQTPKPGAVQTLLRDEKIVASLARDSSLANRLAVLRNHGVSWTYVESIWRLCCDRDLQPPPEASMGRKKLEERVLSICQEYRELADDICEIFKLMPQERGRIMEALNGL